MNFFKINSLSNLTLVPSKIILSDSCSRYGISVVKDIVPSKEPISKYMATVASLFLNSGYFHEISYP